MPYNDLPCYRWVLSVILTLTSYSNRLWSERELVIGWGGQERETELVRQNQNKFIFLPSVTTKKERKIRDDSITIHFVDRIHLHQQGCQADPLTGDESLLWSNHSWAGSHAGSSPTLSGLQREAFQTTSPQNSSTTDWHRHKAGWCCSAGQTFSLSVFWTRTALCDHCTGQYPRWKKEKNCLPFSSLKSLASLSGLGLGQESMPKRPCLSLPLMWVWCSWWLSSGTEGIINSRAWRQGQKGHIQATSYNIQVYPRKWDVKLKEKQFCPRLVYSTLCKTVSQSHSVWGLLNLCVSRKKKSQRVWHIQESAPTTIYLGKAEAKVGVFSAFISVSLLFWNPFSPLLVLSRSCLLLLFPCLFNIATCRWSRDNVGQHNAQFFSSSMGQWSMPALPSTIFRNPDILKCLLVWSLILRRLGRLK